MPLKPCFLKRIINKLFPFSLLWKIFWNILSRSVLNKHEASSIKKTINVNISWYSALNKISNSRVVITNDEKEIKYVLYEV